MEWISFILCLVVISSIDVESKSIDKKIEDAMMTDNMDEMMMGSMPNSVLTELDIMMSRPEYNQKMGRGRQKRKARRDTDYRWKNGVIPYIYSSQNSFSNEDKAIIAAAMQLWERYTCVTFRPKREGDSNYVIFFSGMGCWSSVGREPAGPQPLSLAPQCFEIGIVLHEIGHAIGLEHEHTRPDRDQYVTINYENIEDDPYVYVQFNKFSPEEVNTYRVPYDYISIMHYGKDYWQKEGAMGDTITTVDSAAQNLIGQSEHLSYGDVAIVNKMYKCSDHCTRRDRCTKQLGRQAFLGKDCTCWCHLYWMYH